MIDIHCHLLPGLDDGPSELEESLAMARELAQLGFTHVCATPHHSWGSEGLSLDLVSGLCQELKTRLRAEGVDLELIPGVEHYVTEVAELLASDGLACYPRGDTFLMEFALQGFPPRLDELLFLAQVKSKIPVIAHLERYPQVQKQPSLVESLRERGCYLLVNATSLGGGWDRKAERAARELVANHLVDAATTDLHNTHGVAALTKGLAIIRELLDSESIWRLLVQAPAEIAGLKVEGKRSP